MPVKRRAMNREDWPRVEQKSFAYAAVCGGEARGIASLHHFRKVNQPLVVKYKGEHTLCLVCDGSYWLQYAPQGRNWWLTAAYNPRGGLVQFYFDITLQNVLLPNGQSYFYDLFLDVVMMPDGDTLLLDEDELDEALAKREITHGQYALAKSEATALLRGLPPRRDELTAFCGEWFGRLKARLE